MEEWLPWLGGILLICWLCFGFKKTIPRSDTFDLAVDRAEVRFRISNNGPYDAAFVAALFSVQASAAAHRFNDYIDGTTTGTMR